MENQQIIAGLSWLAIIMLSVSYWFQIWKIHIHKEVRDLSLPYHILLALGFGILALTAFVEGSTIFLVKQIATTIPVIIIIFQIFIHRQDTWHDEDSSLCRSCTKELDPFWSFCAYCGEPAKEQPAPASDEIELHSPQAQTPQRNLRTLPASET